MSGVQGMLISLGHDSSVGSVCPYGVIYYAGRCRTPQNWQSPLRSVPFYNNRRPHACNTAHCSHFTGTPAAAVVTHWNFCRVPTNRVPNMRAARRFVLSSAASVGRFGGRSSGTSPVTLSSDPLSCLAWPLTMTADSRRLRPAEGSRCSASPRLGDCSLPVSAGATTALLILLVSRLPSCLLPGPSSAAELDLCRPRAGAPSLSATAAEEPAALLPWEYSRSNTEGRLGAVGGSRGPGPEQEEAAVGRPCRRSTQTLGMPELCYVLLTCCGAK